MREVEKGGNGMTGITLAPGQVQRFSLGDDIVLYIRWRWWRNPIRWARKRWEWWRTPEAKAPLVVTGVDCEAGRITVESKT